MHLKFSEWFISGRWLKFISSFIFLASGIIYIFFAFLALIKQEPIFALLGIDNNEIISTTIITGSIGAIMTILFYITQIIYSIKKVTDNLDKSNTFFGVNELYGIASRNQIMTNKYQSLDIYAPTGLWTQNDEKRLWLKTVINEAQNGLIVRFVFGVPRTKDQWITMKSILEEYFNNKKNIEIGYYPPLPSEHPDTVMAVVIATAKVHSSIDSWILFALGTENNTVLTDMGISHTSKEAVDRGYNWFNKKIWEYCINTQMLYKPSPNNLAREVTIANAIETIEEKYPDLK